MATLNDFTPVLAQTITSLPQAVIMIDEESSIHFVNPGALKLFGYNAHELEGMSLDTLIPAAFRRHHRQKVKEFIAGRSPDLRSVHPLHFIAYRKDGQTFPAEASIARLAVPGVPPMGMVVLSDTSSRAANEQFLNLQLGRSLDRIDEPIFMMDREWRYTFVNLAAAGFVGRSRDELLGQNIWELSPWLRETPFGRACQRAMKSTEPFAIEDHYKPRDRWLSVHYLPGPDGFTVHITDITDLKQSRMELARLVDGTSSQRQLHTAFDLMPNPMLMVDSELRYTYANAAGLVPNQRTREQTIGAKVDDLNPALKGSELVRHCRKALDSGEAQSLEFNLPPSGRWFQVEIIPWDGQVIVAGADITKLKQSENSVGTLTTTLEQVLDSGWNRPPTRSRSTKRGK